MLTAQVSPRYASLRDALRAHTHVQHERLHEHSSFVALFNQSLDIEGYLALTARLHGFYLPLDRAIENAGADAGFAYARRSGLLARDLQDLGWSADAIDQNPLCDAVSGIVTPTTLGGVLYVIEGATLGGARIDRAARKLFGTDDPAGRRFWSWCRAEGGQRWPMITDHLNRLEAQGADFADLKAGAADTFRMLADWLAPLDRVHRAGETRVS